MKEYFADFHIHVGRSQGRPVKMAAAPSLTLENLLRHAKDEKGLQIVTVIDGVCTGVQVDVQRLLAAGQLVLAVGGGYLFEGELLVLLGAEVEVAGPDGGAAHFGCWVPDLAAAASFSQWLATVQTNPSLSSQVARVSATELAEQTHQRGGLFIVHHAFTPHKGLYGNCVEHLVEMVDPAAVDAVELGLSADTNMADCVSELADLTFLSNSDAHSLPKIAREYNCIRLAELSFREVALALHRTAGRAIVGNFGLMPALGKYHRSLCLDCGRTWGVGAPTCACGSTKRVMGVFDRLLEIRDRDAPIHPPHRPPYIHQVPLEFVPGVGKKTLARLIQTFGSEMAVLHRADRTELASVVGQSLAERIAAARLGRLHVIEGGGGVYGSIQL